MSKRNKYTKELLEPIVARNITWANVCRDLGVKPMTGSQTHVKKVSIQFGIDYTHFIGSAWNKGREFFPKKVLSYYLKVDGPFINSGGLRKKLIKEGVKENKCEKCKKMKWMGKDIPLELDHINSDHFDNRLENLMILCPNCHAVKTQEAKNPRMAKQ